MTGPACVGLEVWLRGRGFTAFCVVDDDGAEASDAAATIAGCGYVSGQATIVRAGTYREDVRPTAAPFALVAYPGERPVVSGADVVAPGGWADAGDGVWRHTWAWDPQDNGDGQRAAVRRREFLVLDGAALDQVGGEARPALEDGQFWVEGPPSAPTAVYLNPLGNADPNRATVEVGQRWQLFWPADVTSHKCHNTDQSGHLIAGMTFQHGTANRQHFNLCLGRSGGVLLDSDVSWNNGGPVDLDGSGHVVVGSRFRFNTVEGPGGTGAHDGLLAFNEIRGNGWEEHAGGHGGGGKFTRTRGLVVRNNVYAENDVNGLWLDVRNRHVAVLSNLFQGNASSGLFIELFSDSVLVANNVFFQNRMRTSDAQGAARLQGSVKVVDSNGLVLAHNTVVGAANAALAVSATDRSLWPCDQDGDPACGPNESAHGQNDGPPGIDRGPFRSHGHRVYNNLLMAENVGPYVNDHGRTIYPRANAIWDWGRRGGRRAERRLAGKLGLEQGARRSTLQTYNSVSSGLNTNAYADWASGMDDAGGGVFASPLQVLLDATSPAGAVRLAPGSPAIDGGIGAPPDLLDLFVGGPLETVARVAFSQDIWGRPRGAVPDVGAVEDE